MHSLFTYTPYSKGSTEYHTAFPPQASNGGSDGVPRRLIVPFLPKPAVLTTLKPDPSQGTPGTAISADPDYPGSALPRPQRGDGSGAEQAQAKGCKAMIIRVKAKVKQWQAQIHRYYLKLMRRHVALTTKLAFRYVRLVVFIIGILRRLLFRKTALPYGTAKVFVRNRRDSLFRRRAVDDGFRILPFQIPGHPRLGQPVIDRPISKRITTNTMKKTIKIGLSAGMAFAFMFATSLSMVAQEHITTPTDKAEVEFVQANVMANTVQKLNSYLAQSKTNRNALTNVVMKEPMVKEVVKSELQERWFLVDPSGNIQSPYVEEGDLGVCDMEYDEDLEVCAVSFLIGEDDDEAPTNHIDNTDLRNGIHQTANAKYKPEDTAR